MTAALSLRNMRCMPTRRTLDTVLTSPWPAARGDALVQATYALGAAALAGEAVVHIQQFFSFYHQVSWIGPLFLVNAAACLVVIAGLAYPRTRELAAVSGVVISALALCGLIVSYGTGLFGWQEVGFATAIELVLIFEVAAVILLSAALAVPALVKSNSDRV
jgi:hypothetical protein